MSDRECESEKESTCAITPNTVAKFCEFIRFNSEFSDTFHEHSTLTRGGEEARTCMRKKSNSLTRHWLTAGREGTSDWYANAL